ncbi:hypothetical protein [Desulfothermobacter acidiphilus]|uniref:hypothetical protein n=1 Tax=Desulfothermobacter acidiphilus TaxID=1938353 RepID=UPI003F8B3A69
MAGTVKACALKKWFNTNYHYIVPEWEKERRLVTNPYLEAFQRARQALGVNGKPVLVGPFTFVKLSRGYRDWREAKEAWSPPRSWRSWLRWPGNIRYR